MIYDVCLRSARLAVRSVRCVAVAAPQQHDRVVRYRGGGFVVFEGARGCLWPFRVSTVWGGERLNVL